MRRILPLAIAMVAVACSTTTPTSPTTENRQPTTAAKQPLFGPHGFDLNGVDSTVKACDDFYRFAVGKWRDTHPLPAQYARYGRFEELSERNRDVLHAILEEAAAAAPTAPKGSAQQKIGDFYAACMNEAAIDQAGVTPIQAELDRINAISDHNTLLAEVTRLHDMGYAPLFRVGGQNDFKNSKMIIASVGTGQLGLPDRDYYLRDDERFKNIRSQYIDHIANMLTLAGESASQARSEAERILQLETRLAQAQMPREEMRNPENRYHMMSVSQLASTAPAVDWNAYLNALGVNQQNVNVTEPKYIE
ncbi:MAG TPA: M13 family metallopeptidase N-terminal domain-containing protein, partial [Thermoanaerobaculia bacterium]|nr:M13 family metallopeptidase N-terminal domain-containing protein [Thermoanaerobaculia bacterium]